MNNFILSLFESFFDYPRFSDYLGAAFNNGDFATIGYIMLLLPILVMVLFYYHKLWDPVRKQLLWWIVSVFVVALISYTLTTIVLYNNQELLVIIDNNANNPEAPDGDMFIAKLSFISSCYAAVVAFFYSLFLKRFISSNNSHNPF